MLVSLEKSDWKNSMVEVEVKEVHFFVLVHGNHGQKEDFDEIEKVILSIEEYKTITLKSEVNDNTHLGIEVGGKKLAKEILEFVEKESEFFKTEKEINFSIIGHSLGGLYSRNCLKFLWQNDFQKKFHFKKYISLSSPHLGSRRPKDGYLNYIWGKSVDWYLTIIGQTGYELGQFDEEQLLLKMSKEKEYIEPLNSFDSKIIISISHYDVPVGYSSSALTHYNPHKPSEYGSIGYTILDRNKEIPKYEKNETQKYIVDNFESIEIDIEMMENLNKINWEKIDIEFQIDAYSRRICVHDLIIKKKSKIPFMNSDELEQTGEEWLSKDFLKIIKK